jgi:hypothetical protein
MFIVLYPHKRLSNGDAECEEFLPDEGCQEYYPGSGDKMERKWIFLCKYAVGESKEEFEEDCGDWGVRWVN